MMSQSNLYSVQTPIGILLNSCAARKSVHWKGEVDKYTTQGPRDQETNK